MKKIVLSFDFDFSFIVKLIGAVIGLTILMSVVSLFFRYSTIQHDLFGFAPKFDMDEENTIPTFISSMNLLIAAGLLGFITYIIKKSDGRHWKQWAILCFIFFFLSMDESASLHEGVSRKFDTMAGYFSGSTHYAWAILGSGLILVFLIYFSRFILSLPTKSRNRFILSGAIFLAGAIGVEAVGGFIFSQLGTDTLVYQVSVIAEESLEMIGIYLFISSLFQHIAGSLAMQEASQPENVILRMQPQQEEKYSELLQERA